jgi:hypothetical protein
MDRQQTRRAGRPFANGVQQPQTLLSNLPFRSALRSAGRGRRHTLRLFHHKLRRTPVGRDIRQTSCRDHAVGDGLLLAEDTLQFCLLFRQAEGGDVRKADADSSVFFSCKSLSLCA